MIPFPYGRQRPSSDQYVLTHGRDQLGGKPRLADTRLADDRDDPTRPVGDDPLELRQQRLQLRDAPDKRGVHPPRHTRHVRLDVEQQPRIDRLGLPLQLQRRHRLDRDRVTNEPDRRVTDEDLPGGRGRLEPLRNDNGIAGRKRITLRRITRVDLARMHSRPHTDPEPRTPPRVRRSGA